MVGYTISPFPACRNWINWATPLPIEAKAGINIQNHHPRPVPENARAIETTRKAMPVKNFAMAPSQWTGRPLRLTSAGGGDKGAPAIALDTPPRPVPQVLQNFPSSGFCPPHFGQNIFVNSFPSAVSLQIVLRPPRPIRSTNLFFHTSVSLPRRRSSRLPADEGRRLPRPGPVRLAAPSRTRCNPSRHPRSSRRPKCLFPLEPL